MLEAIFAGLFGLLIGSFLNVCIYRLPRDLSVVAPRSFCPGCHRPIAAFDNIPVLTYVILRGKCRRCGISIPIRYPIVEALTGTLFFAAVATLGPTLAAMKLCAFSALQVGLIFTDLEERILPDEFTIGGAVLGLALAPFATMSGLLTFLMFAETMSPRLASFLEALFGALVSGGLLWFVGAVYKLVRKREGLGLGDVKMIAMVGAFVGIQGALLTVMIGSILGTIIGIAFILLAGKDSAYELPFGSFLGAAAILAAFLQVWPAY